MCDREGHWDLPFPDGEMGCGWTEFALGSEDFVGVFGCEDFRCCGAGEEKMLAMVSFLRLYWGSCWKGGRTGFVSRRKRREEQLRS